MYVSVRLWTPEQLKDFVKQRPLKVSDVQFFVDGVLRGVSFMTGVKNAFLEVDNLDNPTGYTIKIGLSYPQEEREIALIHEIIHAAYDVKTYWLPVEFTENGRAEELEAIIEAEAQRFCQENKEFVAEMYATLWEKYQPK